MGEVLPTFGPVNYQDWLPAQDRIPKIAMVATPAHDGRVDAEFAYSLAESVRLCEKEGCTLRPIFWPGEALIQIARNELVKMAIGAKIPLLFIDGDQSWKPEWVVRVLRSPADVLGAPVVKKDEKESYNVHSKSGLFVRAGNLTVVDGIGTGFLKLSYPAMKALWNASEPYTDDFGNTNRMMFEVSVKNGRLVSEDIGIADKLHEAGFRIHIDPSMTCSHIGRKKYTGDFAKWLAALAAKAVAVA